MCMRACVQRAVFEKSCVLKDEGNVEREVSQAMPIDEQRQEHTAAALTASINPVEPTVLSVGNRQRRLAIR